MKAVFNVIFCFMPRSDQTRIIWLLLLRMEEIERSSQTKKYPKIQSGGMVGVLCFRRFSLFLNQDTNESTGDHG